MSLLAVTVDEVIQLLLEGRVRGVALGMRGDALPATLGPADWMLRPAKGMTVARYANGLEVTVQHDHVVMIQLRTTVRLRRRTARLARRTQRLVEQRLAAAGMEAVCAWREEDEAWTLRLGPRRSVIADVLGLTVTISL